MKHLISSVTGVLLLLVVALPVALVLLAGIDPFYLAEVVRHPLHNGALQHIHSITPLNGFSAK